MLLILSRLIAQAVEHGAVTDFSLAIALRIIRCGESMGDLVFGAEAGYLFASKVRSVIRDDGMGSPK